MSAIRKDIDNSTTARTHGEAKLELSPSTTAFQFDSQMTQINSVHENTKTGLKSYVYSIEAINCLSKNQLQSGLDRITCRMRNKNNVTSCSSLEADESHTQQRLILTHDKRFRNKRFQRPALSRSVTEELDHNMTGNVEIGASRSHSLVFESSQSQKKCRTAATVTTADESDTLLEDTYHHDSGYRYRWVCEKCKARRFLSYSEAFEHENTCKGVEVRTWKCEKCEVASFASFSACVEHERSCLHRPTCSTIEL